jgi:hypothetical protein
VLEKNKTDVRQVRPSRKEPFTDKEIRALLGQVSTVVISKGKKSSVRNPRASTPAT